MRRVELDKVGAVASMACAVHCAVLPIAISLSAAGVFSFMDNEPIEWGFVLLAGALGTVSAWRGYRKHGNKTVAAVLAAAALGLVLATISRHGSGAHDPSRTLAWILPLIGLTIAVAHIVNLRLCRACRGCAGDGV
jgi:peptidoglycan/LPS O-acetylase OafA/YrhL